LGHRPHFGGKFINLDVSVAVSGFGVLMTQRFLNQRQIAGKFKQSIGKVKWRTWANNAIFSVGLLRRYLIFHFA